MIEQFFITVNDWMSGGFAIAAVGCFVWGVVSVMFSPCHLASIPLIVGYVAGQDSVLEVKQAARYSVVFTVGLFVTIAALGIICSLLGRMLGEIGPYWTILVGAVLIWISLDMLGVAACSMSGGINRLKVRGLSGAFVLGLTYGILSGSCTFGFIAPILAVITIQQKIITGVVYILLFGIGHCIPIAVAGSSTALVGNILQNSSFQKGSIWFRRLAGVAVGLLGAYFVGKPFWV